MRITKITPFALHVPVTRSRIADSMHQVTHWGAPGFVYGSNRGHDSIVIYTVDKVTGKLTYVGHEPSHGACPRGCAIDPTGTLLLVANQDTSSISTFRIDQAIGKLAATGHTAQVPTPVCLQVLLSDG